MFSHVACASGPGAQHQGLVQCDARLFEAVLPSLMKAIYIVRS